MSLWFGFFFDNINNYWWVHGPWQCQKATPLAHVQSHIRTGAKSPLYFRQFSRYLSPKMHAQERIHVCLIPVFHIVYTYLLRYYLGFRLSEAWSPSLYALEKLVLKLDCNKYQITYQTSITVFTILSFSSKIMLRATQYFVKSYPIYVI